MGRHCARSTCPFCGWHFTGAVCAKRSRFHPRAPDQWRIRCCKCGALGPIGETRKEAGELWDARQFTRLDRHGEPPLIDVEAMLR